MADSSSRQHQLHVAIFPWLAFGHVMPGRELAEHLASRGHRVSLVSAPRILSRLRPAAPALIDLVALPFPLVDGLPEGVQVTSDLPPGKTELLLEALDRLAPAFSAFLDTASAGGSKVDWVILDNFHSAIAEVAVAKDVPCIMNMPYSAVTAVTHGIPDPSASPIFRRFVDTLEQCKLVSYRSSFEFEPESVPHLAKILGKPVLPLGLLPPRPTQAARNTDDDDDGTSQLLSWLHQQPPNSVLYAAFGSELHMSRKQLYEIALALELAGTRFLWLLKSVVDKDDLLPPGFEDRVGGRGSIVTSWVHQPSILGHGAVGAFMTHCGWCSTIEGLRYGHPLIMMPVLMDHECTARVLHERKTGVKVDRCKEEEAFLRHDIVSAIRAVMLDQESKEIFAANAKKAQEIVADDEVQDRYIDEFVQCLRTYNN